MRRDVRAAHLVEHVRTLAYERPVNGILNAEEYSGGMGVEELTDPVAIINARAQAEGWPFRCDAKLVFLRPDLNTLCDAWHSHATTSPMSNRTLFEVKALKSLLRRVTVIERVPGPKDRSRYRIQYQGSYLAALMGSNVGRFIDEGIPPALLPRWELLFNTVLDCGAPIRIEAEFEFEKLAYAAAEAFVAPLSNGAGKVNLVLVGVFIRPRETDVAEPPDA